MNKRVVSTCVVVGFVLLTIGCSDKREPNVMFEYTSIPDRPEILDSGPSAIRVCIAKVDVNWQIRERDHRYPSRPNVTYRMTYTDGEGNVQENTWQMSATTGSGAQRTGEMWENTIRGQLAALIEDYATADGKQVVIVERDELQTILDERDLKVADIVEDETLSAEAKLLPIDVFIFAKIDGETLLEYERKKTNPALKAAGFVSGLARSGNAVREQQTEIRRTITCAGNIRLVDASNARTWLTHAITMQSKTDAESGWWEDASPSDFAPEEEEIKNLLDSETRRFVGRLVPTPQTVQLYLETSSHESAKEGLGLLQAGDPAAALVAFERAIAEENDDKDLYAAGVCCEFLSRLADAKEYYKRAMAIAGGAERDDYEYDYKLASDRIQMRLEAGEPAMPPANTYATDAEDRATNVQDVEPTAIQQPASTD